MAHAILLGLIFAALASGARYVDYLGVKMPEYGVEVPDYPETRNVVANTPDAYRDRSPDASASLDYKYEEDSNDQRVTPKSDDSIEVDTADLASLHKSHRKRKRLPQSIDDADYRAKKMIPKFKSNDQYLKHRPRINNKNFEREAAIPYIKHPQYLVNKDRSDVNIESSYHINQDDPHDRKSINFEDNKNIFSSKSTSEKARKARRKPRDRYVKSPQEDDDDTIESNEGILVGKLGKEGGSDTDYLASYEGRRKIAGGLNKEDISDIEYPTGNERRWIMAEGSNKGSKIDKQFYKDNKGRRFRPIVDRLSSAQQYIPSLDYLEDTTLKLNKLEQKSYDKYDDYYDTKRIYNIKKKLPSLLRQTTIATKLVPERPTRPPVNWPYRRAMAPIPLIPTSTTDTVPLRTTTSTATTTATITTTTTSTTTIQASSIARKDLSLQEKSRLSILKKAQRKESMSNETSTKKPPVLLQVVTKMQTVIMVEPPSSLGPFLRAREVSGDSAERLDQVKRMMRHKLVANAKNIRDLTDNWDDMVCDYVDVSLLENSTTIKNLSVLASACCMLFFVLSN